jgi:antitoxin MazE
MSYRREAKVRVKMKRWGNTAVVRIPSAVLRASGLDLDKVVDVREQAGRIVIESIRQKVYDLKELLKAISPKNQHECVDFGEPMGKEGACVELRE